MPFGLRNAGATYQRLVDKAFHKQIGKNLKVYVDDLVIKSRTGNEIVRDIKETFNTIREINMKLNPKKCTFGIEEGMFLGYKVSTRVLKVCPDKSHQWKKKNSLSTWQQQKKRSSCTGGSVAGLILTDPEGVEFTYALRFRFDATNNKAEYKALIAELNIAEKIGVKNLKANVDSRLVANQVNETYVAKETDMTRYLEKVKVLTNSFKALSIKQVHRSGKKADALSKIASTSFSHLNGTLPAEIKKARAVRRKSWRFSIINGTLYKKSFLGPWLRYVGLLQANYVPREIHEGACSMHVGTRSAMAKALRTGYYYPTMHKDIEAKPVATITGYQIKRFVWDNIVCRFGLPEEIISDNGKQLWDDPFKDWCEKLCICQHFASVKHPQTNKLMKRANRSLGEGIKASNGDTSFSLTYETEAVIPTEIGMPTLRTAEVDLVQNNEALEINLDLMEERREEAAIHEAKSKKWKNTIT
uniref:Reverse transcriptase domain-containing protein n=1 Tax=Tanacetum cinerariifolium TaxID=118510 RepID=A0A699GTI6_TANCI|nr:reverse transcriptase domain-containing protein [Tanacetum cinerariifolium]